MIARKLTPKFPSGTASAPSRKEPMTTKGKIIAGSFVAVVVTGLILAATGMFAQSTPLTRAFDKCEAYHQETDGYSEELARDVCVDQSAIRDSDWFIKEWS